ncbi:MULTISPECIES: HNH endonuclease signature motif containing protein [Arthrobacter]|uniref:DUF222 domain-containing protein n=2 Tax=Arthrobacter TaxID=1663 RepID=A0ABU9KNV1_9MICC|nr:HNH endonuclease signature motif containing protein [Arthrobacter sp. YJM1]MDP5228588.1 DUF222 domain-containing protein [Arthrobacter sp. YJM1]
MEAESSTREDRTAAADPESLLAGMVSSLVDIDSAIASLQALREYTLAMASRLAEVMADDGAGFGSPLGERDGLLDSKALELAQRSVSAELATATRTSDRSIQHQMSAAVELLDGFPATFHALGQGRISAAHVRVIKEHGAPIADPTARARYEAAVLAVAEVQAPGRVRRLAAREAEKAQPEPLAVRHERACQERRVWLNPLPEGMAELGAVLPATLAHGVFGRLTHLATTYAEGPGRQDTGRPDTSTDADVSGPGREPRTRDQLRADLLSDLLLHGAPTGHDTPDGLLAGITARVEVTVPVLTLIGDETHEPVAAELNGRHPIDPDTARLLAGGVSAWNRVLTDPITGAVLAVDRYRPSEDLKRLLHARDSRCRFPGCNQPAAELDLDHTRDAAHGGPTSLGNLAGLCRRHHVLKHQSRWTVRQIGLPNKDGENDGPRATIAQRMGLKIGNGNGSQTGPSHGVLEWTSPTGRTHLDHPPAPATHTTSPRRPSGAGSNHPGKHPGGSEFGGAHPGGSDPPPF